LGHSHEVASCNDCHVPHDNPARHYAFKASDGARHAFMFTFRLEPQVIRIHSAGQRVVQENCVRCHDGILHATTLMDVRGDDVRAVEGLRCWACHRDTPHGQVRGLASVPYEHVPLVGPATPLWLRITRPALVEALERMGRNVDQIGHQEMRSLVCAQCHVEYYFRGEGNYLVFPWDEGGIDTDAQEAFLDRVGHTDWIHSISRAPMIKVQHPDYELFQSSVHAFRGLACADCHMPFHREGGLKFTNHHIQSPLNSVSTSCLICHGGTEEEMIERVNDNQDKVFQLRRAAERTLARLHIEAGAAWEAGATEEEMAPILQAIRSAQWRWDWIAASHGGAAHAPVESARLLAMAAQIAGEARLDLARILSRLDVPQPVPMPEWEKSALQAYIGLDMDAQHALKRAFILDTLPQWYLSAAHRQPGPTDYVPRVQEADRLPH
jgi:cytochrome c nitrite reductase small subunit